MTKITFDPPLLPLDDHARSGADIIRFYHDPLEQVISETIVRWNFHAETSDYVWYSDDEGGSFPDHVFAPGYWPLPKIKMEEEK